VKAQSNIHHKQYKQMHFNKTISCTCECKKVKSKLFQINIEAIECIVVSYIQSLGNISKIYIYIYIYIYI